jgi:hypothetical protein
MSKQRLFLVFFLSSCCSLLLGRPVTTGSCHAATQRVTRLPTKSAIRANVDGRNSIAGSSQLRMANQPSLAERFKTLAPESNIDALLLLDDNDSTTTTTTSTTSDHCRIWIVSAALLILVAGASQGYVPFGDGAMTVATSLWSAPLGMTMITWLQTTVLPMATRTFQKLMWMEVWRQVWSHVSHQLVVGRHDKPNVTNADDDDPAASWIHQVCTLLDNTIRLGSAKLVRKTMETSVQEGIATIWHGMVESVSQFSFAEPAAAVVVSMFEFEFDGRVGQLLSSTTVALKSK